MIDPITTTQLIVMASVLGACAVAFQMGRMSHDIFFYQPKPQPKPKRKTGKRKSTSRSRSAK